MLLWLPSALVAEGLSVGLASSIIAQSALLSAPVVVACVYLYGRWSTKWSLVAMTAVMTAGLVALMLRGIGVPFLSNPLIPLTLLVLGSSGVISILLPYTAENYPIGVRGRATGWVAGCSKLGGLIAQGLSALAVVPALGTAALGVTLPAAASLLLICVFGHETRGRDLRELDARARIKEFGTSRP